MPNQKGSLKDRIIAWKRFLKYKKEQKKKLKELKRKKMLTEKQKQVVVSPKHYSKPKVFGLTVLGLFLGLFEPKNKKINLEKEISNIEIKIHNKIVTLEDINKLEKIEQEINEKNYKFFNKKSNKLDSYKKRVEVIKENIKDLEIKDVVNKNAKTSENENITKNQIKKGDNKALDLKKEVELRETNINIIPSKKGLKKAYVPVLEVKQMNKDIDKYAKEISSLQEKIKQEKDYNNLFDYEFKIKQLKLKIEAILLKYEALKELPGFKELENYIKIKDIDIYEIRKNDKKIKEKISLCDKTLIQIEDVKKEIILSEKNKEQNKSADDKEIKKETKQENKKEIKKEEKDNKLLELTLANKIIYDSIAKEQRKINKLQRSLSKMSIKRQRPTIFYYTKNLVSSIFNFAFGLFPISLFKNKMIGGIVSGVMLNNSLRSVKRILQPEVDVKYIYENLENEIITTTNYLDRMNFLLSDSLYQIGDIRKEVIKKYGADINYQVSLIAYLDELDKIESKINFEKEKILGLHNDLDSVYKKNKQKVLTIERQNNYNSQ